MHYAQVLEISNVNFNLGSIATVLYIDDLDNVFIEWVSNGRLTSFSK